MTLNGKFLRLALTLIVATSLSGCIRSRVLITSDPPEAEVTWHGEPRGVTPIEIPFIWYWYYDIEIEKEGYVPLATVERFSTPPWMIMPLDLLAELAPFPIRDKRERHYVLEKEVETSVDAVE